MVVAFVRSHAPEFVKAAGTTDTYALTATVPAGNLLVMALVHDNAAVASKPLVSSISKAAGESASWVHLGRALSTSTSTGAFADGELWCIKTTVDWANATSLTVTYDTSITQKSQNILEYSGVEATLRSTVGTNYSTTTTAASAVTTGTTPVIGDLAIGLIFGSNVAAAQAGDTDTTGGSWSSVTGVGSTGGSGATNNYGITQYKILTSTSHQTLNNSAAMTAGNGAIVAILQASIDPLITQAAYRIYGDGTERPVTLLDSYDETNHAGAGSTMSTALGFTSMGQTFLGDGNYITRAGFWLRTNSGTPNGTMTAELYAHTGTFGSTGLPTGAALARSTAINSTVVDSITNRWVEFDFAVPYQLSNGTPYAIVLTTTNTVDAGLVLGSDTTTPTHPGTVVRYQPSAWVVASAVDSIFRVYTTTLDGGALAAQDTAPTVVVTSDANVQVRLRLQETAGGVQSATTDWQLQWEKNTSGTWRPLQETVTNLVPNPSFEVNTTGWAAQINTTIAQDSTKGGAVSGSGSQASLATSTNATPNVNQINNASPYVTVSPSTTYRVSAYAWDASGTMTMNVSYYTAGLVFISGSTGTSPGAATGAWHRHDETVTTPSNAAAARINFARNSAAAGEQFWIDGVMITAGSTLYDYFDGATAGASWSGTAHNSTSSILVTGTTVVPYASSLLDNTAPSTNRLTGGSGTFVAGDVAEDGVCNDQGLSASNHTELVYSVTLKSADLANADSLRFRVLRNGVTTGMTYTAYPTITVSKVTTPQGAGTGSWSFTGAGVGYRLPKASPVGAWSFTGAAVGKRVAKAAPVGSWSFTGAAVGTAPAAAPGAGIGAGAWVFTGAAVGKRVAKAAPTGTWTWAGAAVGKKSPVATATGAWSFTGAATGKRVAKAAPVGAWVFAGAAVGSAPAVGMKYGTATGTWTWVGAAVGKRSPKATPTGAWSFAGAAVGSAPAVGMKYGTATGTWAFTGAAVGKRNPKASPVGTWTFTGTSVGDAPPNRGTTTGTWNYTGTVVGKRVAKATTTGTWSLAGAAVGKRVAKATPTGAWAFTGAAVGYRLPKATSSGAWSFTGAAVGKRTPKATATGTWSFAGTGVGKRTPKATSAGTWTWTGVATGTAPVVGQNDGFALGAVHWTGVAAARTTHRGTAAGTWNLTGVAAAQTTHRGITTGAWSYAGAAVGKKPAKAITTGTWTWAGTSVGKRNPKAAPTGTWAWVGVAVGRRVPKATATGSWVYTGTAGGLTSHRATAAGSWLYVGTAFGDAPPNQGTAVGTLTWVGVGVGLAPALDFADGTAAGVWWFTGYAPGLARLFPAPATRVSVAAADPRVSIAGRDPRVSVAAADPRVSVAPPDPRVSVGTTSDRISISQ